MITFSPATHDHGRYIADRIRVLDREELRLTGAHDPARAIEVAIGLSQGYAITASVDGRPAAVFGIAPNYAVGEACPWMLGTDEVTTHARTLIQWADGVTSHWLSEFPILMNEVWVGNKPAVRFLRRIGFTFAEPRMNEYGAAMTLFYMRRS